MPLTLNEQVADAVTAENFKVGGGAPAHSMNLALQNAAGQQHRVNELANSVLGNAMNSAQQMQQLASQQALNMSANAANLATAFNARAARFVLDISGEQAAGFARELQVDLPRDLANIGAQISSLQQDAKIAQTTPPQTGTGGAFGSETGLSQEIGLALANLSAATTNSNQQLTQALAGLAAGVAAIQQLLARGGGGTP